MPGSGVKLDYPMLDYVLAWKVYRTLSNEDIEIATRVAEFLDRLELDHRILDIGPGDGRVLSRALLLSARRPAHVTLVEPNRHFLREALGSINSETIAATITPLGKKLARCTDEEVAGFAAILCTHTAYFLNESEFGRLLDLVRRGSRLLVILDEPSSVFSELWSRTAPKYFERARGHIRTVESLPEKEFLVRKGQVHAKLSDPFRLRQDVQNLVLSMLCYSEVDDMHEEMLSAVCETVRRHSSRDGSIECTSSVYEISLRRDLI